MFKIKIQIIYFILMTIITLIGVWLFNASRTDKKFKFKKQKYLQLKNIFMDAKKSKAINEIFEKAEINISFFQYQLIRYIFFSISIVTIAFSYFYRGYGQIPLMQIVVNIILFLASSPNIGNGKKTPFLMCIESIGNKVKTRRNLEIYRAISQLKNLSIIYQESPPGALFILEQLRRFMIKIRPAFNTMMREWERDKKEEACAYFANEIGTPEAAKFTDILIKLDDLSPKELKKQLELFQESVRKERETQKLQSNENIGSLVYFTVMGSAFIVAMNFIIVAFYCDYINLMQFI